MRAYYRLGASSDWVFQDQQAYPSIKEELEKDGWANTVLYVFDQDKQLMIAIDISKELVELEDYARRQPVLDYHVAYARELDKVVTGALMRQHLGI